MGYFYSLGISFDRITDAEECSSAFKENNIRLSDSTGVDCDGYTTKSCYLDDVPAQYVCQIFPDGMGDYHTNKNLFKRPYFYEIQDHLLRFLFHLELPFNYALWEAEGADRILSDDVATDLKRNGIEPHYGLGKDEMGDPNAAYFSGFGASYYEDKKYLDGVVISESKFPEIRLAFPEFEVFKNGYNWLPTHSGEKL